MDFSIAVEEKSEIARDINISIPRGLYQERYKKALSQVAKTARIKGFRPGHVPQQMVDKIYGARVHEDVVRDLFSKAYQEAVEKHELKVVGYPEIDLSAEDLKSSDKDLSVTASVSVIPEPKIKDYWGVKAEVEIGEFDAKLVENQIEKILDQHTIIEVDDTKTEVEKNSFIIADTKGEIDGEPFAGSGGEDVYIEVNSDKLPEGFSEGVLGMKVGETRTITTKMPDDIADQKLAGKEAIYTVTCNAINKKIVPELNDEFVKEKKLGENLAEFRAKIEEDFKKQLERTNKVARDEAVFKALIEKNSFEVPQAMIDEQIREMLFNLRFLDPKKKESYQVDMGRFRKAFSEQAEFQVRRAVIIEQIIAQDKFSVDQEEVDVWLQEQALEFSVTVEKLKEVYDSAENSERLQNSLARERICEKLVAEAKLKESAKKDKAGS